MYIYTKLCTQCHAHGLCIHINKRSLAGDIHLSFFNSFKPHKHFIPSASLNRVVFTCITYNVYMYMCILDMYLSRYIVHLDIVVLYNVQKVYVYVYVQHVHIILCITWTFMCIVQYVFM